MATRRSRVSQAPARNEPETSTLAPSSHQRRLAELEKEQRNLTKRIARKQATLGARRSATERSEREIFSRVQPLREEALKIATELVLLFEQMLGSGSRLSAREKQRAQSVCDDLREWLDLDALFRSFEPEEPAAHEPPGKRQKRRGGRAQGSFEEHRGPSAAKPTRDDNVNLTHLFRRLALALHPDRVRDESEKSERTQRMQELTRAYEEGDLARLLHLERTLSGKEPASGTTNEPLGETHDQKLERLTSVNRELLRQLRDLQKADKQLCARVAGTFDEQGRFHPHAELELFLEELGRDVARLEYVTRFTRRFVTGEISLREFVKGPEPDDDVDLDDHLEALLEAVIADDLARKLDRQGQGRPTRKRQRAATNAAPRRKRHRR